MPNYKHSIIYENLIDNAGLGVWSYSTLTGIGNTITVTDVTAGVCTTGDTEDLVEGKLVLFSSGALSGNCYVVTNVVTDTTFTLHDTLVNDAVGGNCKEAIPKTSYSTTNLSCADKWKSSSNSYDYYRDFKPRAGSLYGLLTIQTNVVTTYISWPNFLKGSSPGFYCQFQDKSVSFGAFVKTDISNKARLFIKDTSTYYYTNYHSGNGEWEYLKLTKHLTSNCTCFEVGLCLESSSNDDEVRMCQPALIKGPDIHPDAYYEPPGQPLYFDHNVASDNFDNKSGLSNINPSELTDIPVYDSTSVIQAKIVNIEADSRGRIPKGVDSVFILSQVADTGQESALSYLYLVSNGMRQIEYYNECSGLVYNMGGSYYGKPCANAWIRLDEDNLGCNYNATGGGTFEIPIFKYTAAILI